MLNKFLFFKIVWDEKTKKWVNKDGDGAESESFKPPPKMGNFGAASPQMLAPTSPIPTQMQQPMAQVPQPSSPAPQMNQFSQQQAPERVPLIQQQAAQQPQTANAASGSAEQMPPAPAAPNMFKMQKGRSETLKNCN